MVAPECDGRHVRRPQRGLLMYLLWRASALRLGDIAAHFHVGYTTVNMACRRAERHLCRDPRLRRGLRKEGLIDI